MAIGLLIGGLAVGAAGTGLQAYGAKKASDAQKKQLEAQHKADKYNASIYDYNADLLYKQAEGVLSTGLKEEEKFRKYVEGVKGSQRASFGGSGAVVDEGSTLDVVKDTAALGEEDALTIRANAYKQYKATREQGNIQKKQAKLIRMGGRPSSPGAALPVASTLLSGASNLAGMAGRYAWGN